MADHAGAPGFSIITTCKGRLKYLQRALPTLVTLPDCEVVVVDYDCPDGVGDWVRRTHPSVKVVHIADRPLFRLPEARNHGAAVATARWLIFLDCDTMAAPDLTQRIAPLLGVGVFLQPEPRPYDLWGAIVVSRADFDAIGGYDEAFEGYGVEDVDIVALLEFAGRTRRTFPGGLLTTLPHSDAERSRFHAINNHRVSMAVNVYYRVIKMDLMRLGAPLDLPARRRLHADVREVFTAPDGPRPLKVTFRQQSFSKQPLLTSLTYEFRDAGLPISHL